ncbi:MULTISPECIES: hypothetical protein [unclassified Microcoleus]|nr:MULTISPECIES: hypothetical protein [unclassified Microcoleus]MCC3444722.1 hypothetical protein [Microcoleus sp. PH2017_03_ELD_O_A]MCC3467001.1 hypothetical protein [Microcoleus sp. PH2017_06_SFM_O_A]MCC3548198.1 hypothetical protein [Microcoleus sp. PH2017_24_DOB_U_A]MCC3557168.1 hypothetical protein [Microcoleus sp. PH2017_35_SFW_U_B]MCC3566037.1 hypothetical protein [Microcoleus sp. PH2017_31_RDM_U_A]MCC3641446.1 hypothetical protein [Microcoleus sp. PH2017_33_LGB_O_A]
MRSTFDSIGILRQSNLSAICDRLQGDRTQIFCPRAFLPSPIHHCQKNLI